MAIAGTLLWLASGCAQPAALDPEPPHFSRPRRAWVPQELDRDVVECARQAGEAVRERPDLDAMTEDAARLALREATVTCMHRYGWTER